MVGNPQQASLMMLPLALATIGLLASIVMIFVIRARAGAAPGAAVVAKDAAFTRGIHDVGDIELEVEAIPRHYPG